MRVRSEARFHIDSPARLRRILVPIILGCLSVIPAGDALGDDNTYPALIAHAGDAQQFGRHWSVTWGSCSDDGGGVVLDAHGFPRYHKNAARFATPATIHLDFTNAQPPESVSIGVARRLRERGHNTVIGKRKYPEYRMVPVADDEGTVVAWAAEFDVFRARHFYMDVEASWPGVDGCDWGQVNWTLHLQGV